MVHQEKLKEIKNAVERAELEYNEGQKKIAGMSIQIANCKQFSGEKKSEIQITTLQKNTLDNGTLLLEAKVNELNSIKIPMVEKIKKYEATTAIAYNEMILMMKMRKNAELNIEEMKRKLENVKSDYYRECNLWKIISTLHDLYEKGMKKMASHNDLRGPNSEPFYGREKAKFKENVVNTIENLTNEIAIEGLENTRNLGDIQKKLEKNTQLMKREQMISERETQ